VETKQIGDRIRRAREERGLSQEDLGVLILRDQRSVSEYESGKRRIYAHDLPRIAKALEVPIMYFYKDVASEYDFDDAPMEMLHLVAPHKRNMIINILRTLVQLAE
jgi:transcriptional regulator with XRE-family HTH domain